MRFVQAPPLTDQQGWPIEHVVLASGVYDVEVLVALEVYPDNQAWSQQQAGRVGLQSARKVSRFVTEPRYTLSVVLSDARMIGALNLRARVALKRELFRLCRAHDAAVAFLGTSSATGDRAHSIEYAGSQQALPRFPNMHGPCSHLCEQRTLRSVGGDDREVVLLYHRMCKDAPMLLLGLVDATEPFTDVLTGDMEETVEKLETMIVDTLDPLPVSTHVHRAASTARI